MTEQEKVEYYSNKSKKKVENRNYRILFNENFYKSYADAMKNTGTSYYLIKKNSQVVYE